MKKQKRSYTEASTSLPFKLCILFGVFLLALYTVLCGIEDLPHDVIGIGLVVLYSAAALFAFFRREQTRARKKLRKQETVAMSTVMAQTIQNVLNSSVITSRKMLIVNILNYTKNSFTASPAIMLITTM